MFRSTGPWPLDQKTASKLQQLFAPQDQDRARELLEEQCGENIPGWESGLARLRQAALKLSQGDLHQLRAAIELTKVDFRDTLMQAGFGDLGAHDRWWPARETSR